MSFLKKLFGGGESKSPAATKSIEHKGFTVAATPYSESGQYQTCGVISKDIDGQRKEHKFIRADRFTSLEEAQEFSINKGCQIIDSMGDRLFSPGNS